MYAVDTASVDQISYVVECKNWTSRISQSVVHSFTTVMYETGANIGFIVCKEGLQQGAEQYLQNTNIRGYTYAEFQQRYLEVWFERYFGPTLGDAADDLLRYTEPFNSYRIKNEFSLEVSILERLETLRTDWSMLATVIMFLKLKRDLPQAGVDLGCPAIDDVGRFKDAMEKALPNGYKLGGKTYRELLGELLKIVRIATEGFNTAFGRNIFRGES